MRVTKFLLILCFACSTSSASDAGPDAGEGMDVGALEDSSAPDIGLGRRDTGPEPDAGPASDSGPRPDAGTGDDAGPGADAGVIDAGSGPTQCSAEVPCEGACTGRSCSANWFCVADAPCTDDIATFCGCDGTTFTGSSSCPSRPYVSTGPCPGREGLSCDPREISCRIPTPECEPGSVPEVTEDGSCWTLRCVDIGECGCSSPAECPDPDNYTCRNDTNRCTPFL